MKKHLCGITSENINTLKENEKFDFGNNLKNIYAAGAAKLGKNPFLREIENFEVVDKTEEYFQKQNEINTFNQENNN